MFARKISLKKLKANQINQKGFYSFFVTFYSYYRRIFKYWRRFLAKLTYVIGLSIDHQLNLRVSRVGNQFRKLGYDVTHLENR